MANKNNDPERQIQNDLEEKLYYYQHTAKVVIGYIDISKLGKRYLPWLGIYVNAASNGEPDLVIWFKHKGMLWTILAEVKNPLSYTWKENQKAFKARFTGLENVVYILAFHPVDVISFIESVTGYTDNKLNEMNEPGITKGITI